MASRPIIIDCDPGIDDAVALWLALASPELEVLGITTVAGNVGLAKTQENARKVCELAERSDIKVFAGCKRPLLRPPHTAEAFHGHDGLANIGLPAPDLPLQPAHAVDWLVETLLAAEEASITLCPLGPLTNIAMAMIKEPDILPKIREIVLMGGSFFAGGNITPTAEFNIYVDPHAAQVVFESGRPLTMIPLDTTHQAQMTPQRIEAIRALASPLSEAAAEMMRPYGAKDAARLEQQGGPLHDPCVIARLLRPELFQGRECHVRIETASETTLGMTVVDWYGVTGKEPNCTVLDRVDAEGFFALLTEGLARLPNRSST